MSKLKKILSVLVLLLVTVLDGTTLFARSTFSETTSNRGLVLTAQLIQYVEGERGKSVTATYKLTNDFDTPQDIDVYPRVVNFIDNEGTPVPDFSQRTPDRDFASWFQLEGGEKVTIRHKETLEFNYKINVPTNAGGGTHSAVIVFPRSPIKEFNPEQSAVGLNEQIQLPVFMTINQDIDFKAAINRMWVTDIKNKDKDFFWFGTARIHTTIENTGNIYIRPYGNIFIHKGDKLKVVKTYDFNEKSNLVQQKNKRTYSVDFSVSQFINEDKDVSWFSGKKYNFSKFFDWKFGRYYATYQARVRPAPEANIEDNKATLALPDQTVSFFVFPIQIIFILLFLILLTVIFIIYRKVRSKKKNTYKM